MFTTINAEPTLWDTILPEAALRLPPGLTGIDELLDDGRFFEPFRPFFDPRQGRPSIPMETYLRMMFLRFRYKLGFETLCAEVSDSIAWRRFCRIPLDAAVPHPTTLLKITARCGPTAVDQLNEALLAKAAEQQLVRLDRVRADSTVVEANVAYPTDSGLLAKAVVSLVGLVMVLKAAGLARRTRFRDRRRSVRRRAHEVAVWLRRRNEDAKDEVLAITGELATLAALTVAEAGQVALNARRALARRGDQPVSGRVRRALREIDRISALTGQIIGQTRIRLAGEVPDGASRVVSLHDPDARPIRTGRLGRPVEFGYKAQVADNADGLVLDHHVVVGNPPDAPMLAPAIARLKARFGRTPTTITADRGYGEAAVDKALAELGVKTVAIPRRGRPGPARTKVQRARRFVRLVKWRTGSEARISTLKRNWGWRRTLLDRHTGVQVWCGWGVLAHNATKLTHLQTSPSVHPRRQRGTDPPTAGPKQAGRSPPREAKKARKQPNTTPTPLLRSP